jgi:hypothetical protein
MMLTALLLSSIALRGQTACPTVQEVSDRLAGLDTDRAGELRWVQLHEERDVLRLSLWRPDGSLEAVRELPLSGSCDALARASAVTIATWAAQMPPPRPEVLQRGEAAAPAPPHVMHTIFDPETLRAERERISTLTQVEVEDPGPTRLRGPFIAMTVGLLGQVAAVIMGLAGGTQGLASWQSGAAVPVLMCFAFGTFNVGTGLVWLLGALGATPHDRAVAF